jgi:hypothetical protein
MKTQNADQFFRHVCNLQTLAGLANNYNDALNLYKKLHRIEARCNRLFTNECNGTSNLTVEQEEKRDARILQQVKDLLPGLKTIFLNGDPRGYALKIKPEEQIELRENKGINLYSDFGGYGILAPEF